MNFLKIVGSSLFQVLSLIFLLGYILGILNVYFSLKNDYCYMTYMYEYPQFVKLKVPDESLYPQYGLWAYSEGRLTERARRLWFDGVPVLFLPGNSGSHMQVRSLASVALRKAFKYDYHFDYYTIDYNEELSGLYGGVLERQTVFAAACISRILDIYKMNTYTKSVPSSVILIGHSMGGLIAKRLLAYPSTLHTTNIAITLAAPLEAPVVNVDMAMNDYYRRIDEEWQTLVRNNSELNDHKLLISLGNGARDLLMPSGLTSSNNSFVNALTTSIPGVWISPDHVSVVWCKQLVKVIIRFLFALVDSNTDQVMHNRRQWMVAARQYFQSNRSTTLNLNAVRSKVTMLADAFWYEDNRRIYQISRPDIEKTTYLMIRLVSFPQNRFVAIEGVNLENREWVFGCNVNEVYRTHRYCKQATSLSELSRWTGAAASFGKRRLATIDLHSLTETHPEWTHVIVQVHPTYKPITLNVDINDYASRRIIVDLPSDFSLGTTIVKQETEPNSLYYELVLPGFDVVSQAYLLYVEPTINCKASQYHVSAEIHIPWAENHENYHYFTQTKRSPMKLRLFKSNPNATYGVDATDHVTVTVMLDPQCTFTISISSSWYYRLGQFARNYTVVLIPYVAAIVLLAARSNIQRLKERGTCVPLHGALMSETVKPYYALVFSRLASMLLVSMPVFSHPLENASWRNLELQYFTRSLLVLPAYMIALGILNVAAFGTIAVMIFSSQLAHRLLFRIMWRGGSGLAERVAAGLQKVPVAVSAALVCAVPLSCGAAALAAGAAFYGFMLSKMYEEYLEDYVYKLMAKIASRICRVFFRKRRDEQTERDTKSLLQKADGTDEQETKNFNTKHEVKETEDTNIIVETTNKENVHASRNKTRRKRGSKSEEDFDEELNNINFHMMLFFLWIVVMLVNIPALLSWARNFKYSMVLRPDTSYYVGFVMSACSALLWQLDGPRKNLQHYDAVSSLLFTTSVCILALGPLSLTVVNYCVTCMFAVITLQQMFDKEDPPTAQHTDDTKPDDDGEQTEVDNQEETNDNSGSSDNKEESKDRSKKRSPKNDLNSENSSKGKTVENAEDCVCNESRIYSVFKDLRDKFTFNEDL